MNDQIADTARAAARRLDAEYGPGLISEVEAVLASQETEQYFDPISLGGLIVSAATLAWTVYNDLRKPKAKPQADAMASRIHAELKSWSNYNPASLSQIIDVVVTEVTEADEPN